MTRIIKSTAVWVALAFVGALFVPVFALTPRHAFFEALNAICMAVGTGVIWAQRHATSKVLRLPVHSIRASDALIVSISAGAAAIVMMTGCLWLWRVTDDDFFINGPVPAFARWLLAASCVGALLTTATHDDVIDYWSYRRAGLLVAASVALVAALIGLGVGKP